jgi:BirA family biotin operon repressor/biotin-[acetyl-CoA-carboxylase] ligase
VNAVRMSTALARCGRYAQIYTYDSLSSTNDRLRTLASAGAAEGTIVLSDEQTSGRGRWGRRWHSPPGQGLYLSVLFRPTSPPRDAARWTLATAVAACEACRDVSGCSVEIKWPNDLLIGGRKVAGILAELRSSSASSELVVGIGINVDHRIEDFPGELKHEATSLRLASRRRDLDREALAIELLLRLAVLADGLSRQEWTPIARRWEELAPAAYDKRVRVAMGSGVPDCEGRTAGLDDSGALRVRRDDGTIVCVHEVDALLAVESRDVTSG